MQHATKEVLRVSFIYSWLSPMFFNILLVIVFYLALNQDSLHTKIQLYFYVWVISFVLTLFFLFIVLLKSFEVRKEKSGRMIFLGLFSFVILTVGIYAAIVPILNIVYGLNLYSYVLRQVL